MEHKLLSASDVLALNDPPWLADRLIPERSLAMLWGPSNIGKSFVSLDLACSVAVGNDWLAHPVEPGRVVYAAGEGVAGFKRRLGGWLEYNALAEDDLSNLYFVPWPLKLHQGVNELMRLLRPINPVLVVVDTLAAASLGIVEDTTEGIGPVLDSLLRIREDLKTAVLVVHHTGWNEEHERGSSSQRGAMDTSIEMSGEDGWKTGRTKTRRTLKCWKQRDAEKFKDIEIKLEESLWLDENGHRKRSLVPSLIL